MLGFLRKYQRLLFILISIFVIFTFSFFGTYGGNSRIEKLDVVAFTTIDGKEVMRSTLDQMMQLLFFTKQISSLQQKEDRIAAYCQSYAQKQIFETSFALEVAQAYSNELRPDFESKIVLERRFKPYVHPTVRSVNIEALWERFQPNVKQDLYTLQESKDPLDAATFQARINLYRARKQVSTALLRQILYYQEKQHFVAESDVLHRDLSLFGYHSLSDWFGDQFLHLLAKTIINGSVMAQQKGYRVDYDEARADLLYANREGLMEEMSKEQKALLEKEFQQYLQQQHMQEKTVVALWQKVLLLQKWFQDVGQSIFVDHLAYSQFLSCAGETAQVELYQLPFDLQFHNYNDLQQFDTYLHAVSEYGKDLSPAGFLSLPLHFSPLEHIKKTAPSLLKKRYQVEIASVDQQMLLQRVGIKQMQSWLLDLSNRASLAAQFPNMKELFQEMDAEIFVRNLEKLQDSQPAILQSLEDFARKCILEQNRNWINEELSSARSERKEITIALAGKNIDIQDIKDPQHLISLLDRSYVPDHQQPSDDNKQAQMQLMQFTPSGQQYYRITVLQQSQELEVMTFSEAKAKGILQSLLQQKLKSYYEKVRQHHTGQFQTKAGKWKPFDAVRNDVADLFFAPLLQAIKQEGSKIVARVPTANSTKNDGDFGAAHRLEKYMQEMHKQIAAQGNDIAIAKQEDTDNIGVELSDQWKIKKTTVILPRSQSHPFLQANELLQEQLGTYCGLKMADKGNWYFYHVLPSTVQMQGLEHIMEQSQELLAQEACQQLLKSLLHAQKNTPSTIKSSA